MCAQYCMILMSFDIRINHCQHIPDGVLDVQWWQNVYTLTVIINIMGNITFFAMLSKVLV